MGPGESRCPLDKLQITSIHSEFQKQTGVAKPSLKHPVTSTTLLTLEENDAAPVPEQRSTLLCPELNYGSLFLSGIS